MNYDQLQQLAQDTWITAYSNPGKGTRIVLSALEQAVKPWKEALETTEAVRLQETRLKLQAEAESLVDAIIRSALEKAYKCAFKDGQVYETEVLKNVAAHASEHDSPNVGSKKVISGVGSSAAMKKET